VKNQNKIKGSVSILKREIQIKGANQYKRSIVQAVHLHHPAHNQVKIKTPHLEITINSSLI
jgi:hypothetical protein